MAGCIAGQHGLFEHLGSGQFGYPALHGLAIRNGCRIIAAAWRALCGMLIQFILADVSAVVFSAIPYLAAGLTF
jgi:hypothetical protein